MRVATWNLERGGKTRAARRAQEEALRELERDVLVVTEPGPFFGLLARIEEVRNKPWLEEVVAIELEEKTRRSLAHRQHLAGIGAFKPVSRFDWKWPRKLGPNGVGKAMLLRNLADRHDRL